MVRSAKEEPGLNEKLASGPPGVAITRPDWPIVTEPLVLPKADEVIVYPTVPGAPYPRTQKLEDCVAPAGIVRVTDPEAVPVSPFPVPVSVL